MSHTPNFLELTVSLSAIIPLIKEESESVQLLRGVGNEMRACVS